MNPADKGSDRQFLKDCQHASGTHYGEEAPDGRYDPAGDPIFNESDNHEQGETHFVSFHLYDVLFTMGDFEDVYLSEGTINLLMDTGCPKTVTGVKWLKQLITSMSPETRSRVRKYPSSTSFRFGGEEVKRSLGFYTIPINVAGKNVILQTDVISSNIPCLVSKAAMKKAGGIINLEEDSIRLYGKVIQMNTNASGHYILPVEQYKMIEGEENKVFIVEHERPEYNEMQIHKMHKALGHPSRAAFEATIKAANVEIDNLNLILNKLYESCLICLKFFKSHVRPKVGLPITVTEMPQEKGDNRYYDYETDSDDEDVIPDKAEPQVNNPGPGPVGDFPDPDMPDLVPHDPEPAPPSPAQFPALDNPAQPPTPPNTDPDKSEERLEEEAEVEDIPNEEEEREMERSKSKPNPKKKGVKLPYPKRGQEIFFRVKSTRSYGKIHPAITTKYADNWVNVTILGKVYKDSQKSGPYFNFRDKEDGFEGGIHLDQTQWTISNTKPLPRTLADSIHNHFVEDDPQLPNVYTVQVARDKWHLPEVREAMKKELENFAKFDVYDLVPDRGQHSITSGWVVVEKEKEGKWITKARLMIQERDTVQSDSPTVKKQNLRIQVALAVQNNWTMCSAEVQAAFFQAVSLDREIFVKPVVEADNPGLLWKLKKPIYGLKDSGRLWYITITDFLKGTDCQMLVTDLACLYWHKDGILHGMITIHVDDIQYCGSPDFEEAVIKPMLDKFKFGMIQRGEFKCLGWDLQQYETHLTVDQIAYAEAKIKPVEIELADRPNEEKLNSEEVTLMRGITGKLRWMDQTRADVCYDLLELSMNAGKAAIKDVKASTKVVNHLKNTPLKIKFNKLDGDEWFVSVYPDAAKNTLPDGESSAMGYIIFLSNGHVTGEVRKVCPLYWKSAKIPRIVGSSFEGEAIALEEGLNVAFTIMKDLAAITGIPEHLLKVEALCDCDDVVKAVNATTQKSGLGRTSWEIGRIRQMIEKKEVTRVKWHEGQSNVADVLTKRGAPKHLMLRALEQGVV